ncbi:MAG: hypothetical protein ABI045_04525 [Flavobacteriales bacterium]
MKPEVCTRAERASLHQSFYTAVFILSVYQLNVSFRKKRIFSDTVVKVLDRVSFEIYKGKTLGLVGESGSGNRTLGRAFFLAARKNYIRTRILFKG